MSTRRKFIRDCTLVAVASTLVPSAFAHDSAVAAVVSPGYDEFFQQLNTPFILRAGDKSVKTVLIRATLLPASSPGAVDARNEKFSLLFRSPAQNALAQGIYEFEHQRLGSLSIFITPVGGANAVHDHYEAVFNRPKNPADLAAQLALAPRPTLNVRPIPA